MYIFNPNCCANFCGWNFGNFFPSFFMPNIFQMPIWNINYSFGNPSFPFNSTPSYMDIPTFPSVFNFGFNQPFNTFQCAPPSGTTRPSKVKTKPAPTAPVNNPNPISNSSNGQKVVDLAESYVSVVTNRQKAHDLFFKSDKVSRMWCSDFVGSVVNDVFGNKIHGLPRMGCVKNIWDWGVKQNCNITTYGMNNKEKGSYIAQNIKPGDVMILRHWYDKDKYGNLYDKPKPIFSHTEIVVEVYSDGSFKTVSGGGDRVRYVKHKPTETDLYGFVCINRLA